VAKEVQLPLHNNSRHDWPTDIRSLAFHCVFVVDFLLPLLIQYPSKAYAFFGPSANFNKDRTILSAAKCNQGTLLVVSGVIRCIWIFTWCPEYRRV